MRGATLAVVCGLLITVASDGVGEPGFPPGMGGGRRCPSCLFFLGRHVTSLPERSVGYTESEAHHLSRGGEAGSDSCWGSSKVLEEHKILWGPSLGDAGSHRGHYSLSSYQAASTCELTEFPAHSGDCRHWAQFYRWGS